MNITLPYKDFLDILVGRKDFSIVDGDLAKQLLACNEVEQLTGIIQLESGLYQVWHPDVWKSGRIKALLGMEEVRRKAGEAIRVLTRISQEHNPGGVIPKNIWDTMLKRIFTNKIVALEHYKVSEAEYDMVVWYQTNYKVIK